MCHSVTSIQAGADRSTRSSKEGTRPVPMLAELVDAVVGVDTHRDTHQVEIAHPNGAPIASTTISNDATGYAELLAWIVDHAPGPRLAISIEGTRSYGVGLARAAAAAGLVVLECEQPHRKTRRGRGKSDPIDAHLAVLTALRLDADQLPTPRADGDREALRILLGARQELTTTSTAQTNRLRALLLGGDDTDRTLARGALTEIRLAGLARRRPPREASREQAVRHAEIRRLALALRETARALKANRAQLQTIVNNLVPGLLERPGIGPVSAAQAIVSFSHPGRCRNDAAFAALGGASPLPASSGRTVRHRLNRGGDRALNRALHTIAATRMRSCPTTRAYVARRTAEGKNPREIRRCLKRYIARHLYRTLATAMTPATEAS
jgi:transposase